MTYLVRITPVLALLAATLAACHQTVRIRHLEMAVGGSSSLIEYRSQLEARRMQLEKQIRYLQTSRSRYRTYLAHLLSQCRSRDDFFIREGTSLVVARLASSTPASERVGIYLPAGRHVLKYAVSQNSEAGRSGLHSRASSEIEFTQEGQATAVELGPQAEVVELQLTWSVNDDGSSVRVAILGGQNAVLHEQIHSLSATGLRVERSAGDRYRVASYPSEYIFDDHRPEIAPPVRFPHTPFLSLVGYRKHDITCKLRIWIESDAPPCVSALDAALYFTDLRSQGVRRHDRTIADFEQLFTGHDGAGKVLFHSHLIQ